MESCLVQTQAGCLQSAGFAGNSGERGSLLMSGSPGCHRNTGSRLCCETAGTEKLEILFYNNVVRNLKDSLVHTQKHIPQ